MLISAQRQQPTQRDVCYSNVTRRMCLIDDDTFMLAKEQNYPLAFDAPVRGIPVGISAPPLVWEN